MVSVTLENISKKFEDVVAVDNLNLKIKNKEFVVLLGPSGCGKTTTLNIISGLERQDSGNVYFDDQLVTLPPDKRDVAMVFQSYALYPHMDAFDNISFSLRIKKVPRDEVKNRVDEAAELLRIKHLLNRKPFQLSGGERQRVALARAIVRQPKAFLFDEPLSNLDAQLRLYTRTELKKLHQKLQATFIYVTHDQVEALTMADRVALMKDGILQQYEKPDILYGQPSNKFVGSFMGSPPMNFIECSFKQKDDTFTLDTPYFELDITEYADEIQKSNSSEFILGVRPENIKIFNKRGKDLIELEVYEIEPMGSDMIIDLKMGEHILKAKSTMEFTSNVGEKIFIQFDKGKLHLFDKNTEKLII